MFSVITDRGIDIELVKNNVNTDISAHIVLHLFDVNTPCCDTEQVKNNVKNDTLSGCVISHALGTKTARLATTCPLMLCVASVIS